MLQNYNQISHTIVHSFGINQEYYDLKRNIEDGFKLVYYGVMGKRNEVGTMLKEDYARNILEQ